MGEDRLFVALQDGQVSHQQLRTHLDQQGLVLDLQDVLEVNHLDSSELELTEFHHLEDIHPLD